MELVVLAGGASARFGKLKQLEVVDENNNFLIDYSIFDAVKAGFKKIIFVVQKNAIGAFENSVAKRLKNKIDFVFAVQEHSEYEKSFPKLKLRTKPLGTGFALFSAKKFISSDFAVINADDFYGRQAFFQVADFLRDKKCQNQNVVLGFNAKKTINNSSGLKRGFCIHNGGYLTEIEECEVWKSNNIFLKKPLSKKNIQTLCDDDLVSMNLFGFRKNFINCLEQSFYNFLKNANLEQDEFFLPSAVNSLIKLNRGVVRVLKTDAKWFGLTFKEDLLKVKTEIEILLKNKKYPLNLWNFK